jgi:hypothetical protein
VHALHQQNAVRTLSTDFVRSMACPGTTRARRILRDQPGLGPIIRGGGRRIPIVGTRIQGSRMCSRRHGRAAGHRVTADCVKLQTPFSDAAWHERGRHGLAPHYSGGNVGRVLDSQRRGGPRLEQPLMRITSALCSKGSPTIAFAAGHPNILTCYLPGTARRPLPFAGKHPTPRLPTVQPARCARTPF